MCVCVCVWSGGGVCGGTDAWSTNGSESVCIFKCKKRDLKNENKWMWECRLSSLEAADECVCVCVYVWVCVLWWGGRDQRTGLRRQDQHQYSGVALTLVVHGPKNRSVGYDTHRRQPKRHVLRPDSNSPRHFPFDNTHTKKSRFLTWGDETTSSWLKTETLSAENKNKKYYVELKNIYFLMHLRNREIRHHILTASSSSFYIQLLQQQNFLIHIKALT